jgi:hypothetical protein
MSRTHAIGSASAENRRPPAGPGRSPKVTGSQPSLTGKARSTTGSLTQALALAQLTGPQIAGLARLASGLVIRSRGCHFAPSLRSPLTSVPTGSQASQSSRSDQTWWAKCGKSGLRIRHSKLVCRTCEISRTASGARFFFCDDLDNGHALLYNSFRNSFSKDYDFIEKAVRWIHKPGLKSWSTSSVSANID